MSSKTRKRIPQKSEDSAKPIAEDEAVGSAAVKDPLVRSPPKPVDQSKVDEYWDLEDDENWVDGQSPGAEKERDEEDIEMARRRRVLKRDSVEVGVAFAFHLVVMCVYIYIHVYDATIIKRNKGKGFEGILTYGGRWKYLTYWNLWIQFVYFFLCFFTDIMPWSSTKYWFMKACDIFFTTVAIPIGMFVVVLFWGIYLVDREMVYPKELDEHIPLILNHFWHTAPLIFILLEILIVFHRYPSNMTATFYNFIVSTIYIVWIVWVFTQANIWPYPFFKLIPFPALPVFFTVNFLISVIFAFVGKFFCYLRWKERHDLMDEMGL